jgi:Phosphotransferase enzyme family
MVSSSPSDVERAVFGEVSRPEIRAWLDRHLWTRLSARVSEVVFRSGRVSSVYGLLLSDGTRVVVKVVRGPVSTGYLTSVARCQRRLVDAGYACPSPLDGPAETDGLTAMIESFLDVGERGNPHDPTIRRALAGSLAQQVQILASADCCVPAEGTPAWTRYDGGPWPRPHDAAFDFSDTPPYYQWLDDLARRASDILSSASTWSPVTGHGDWICHNVRFAGGEVVAAFDWDSLITRPDPVVAGLSAGAFIDGGTSESTAPTPSEAAAFLADYEDFRRTPFTSQERSTALAAATWVLMYNARCMASVAAAELDPPEGSPLQMADRYRDAYLDQIW